MIIKPLKEDFNRIKNMEWMIPLGNGSYTLQNLFFIPERRYHSLFNFASKPPLERVSILHSLDESVKIDGKFYNLYSYKVEKQTMITEGYKNIRKISIQPSSVTYSFVIDSVIIEKIISSDYVNTLSINYAVKNTHNKNVEFFVRPFFELRSSDSLEENEPELNIIGNIIEFKNFSMKPQNNVNFEKKIEQKKIFLEKEFKYGMDYNLNIKSPGYYYFNSQELSNLCLIFGRKNAPMIPHFKLNTIKIKKRNFEAFALFCNSFVVKTDNDNLFIMAGYPWFGPWGRDTFISLPGLLIYRKAFDEAEQIIDSYVSYIKNGIIPNLLSEHGEVLYNSVDASLWLLNSIYELWNVSGDDKYIKKYSNLVDNIIFNYRKGTLNNIYMDKSDYLIYAGDESTQLTWMDAKNQEVTFTPRHGKAVEINALWYNAVCIAEFFSKKNGNNSNAVNYFELSQKIKINFLEKFYCKKNRYLIDFFNEKEKNTELRPNQIFALSLPFNVVDNTAVMKDVILAVSKNLLTPHGLRSLSPKSDNYKGVYEGNWFERDSAYHQGTVWAFLIGPYLEAFLKTNNFSYVSKKYVKLFLKKFAFENTRLTGAGFISEIFNGDPPHIPHGACAQAWSCAEVLRVFLKYFL